MPTLPADLWPLIVIFAPLISKPGWKHAQLQIKWAGGVWGLPFLTVLYPSEQHYAERGRRHQRLTDRAWQVISCPKICQMLSK